MLDRLDQGTLLAWCGVVLITVLAFSRAVAEFVKGKGERQ